MKVSAQNRVTIPAHVRSALGLVPGSEVDVIIRGGEVVIVKAAPTVAPVPDGVERVRGSYRGTLTTAKWMKRTRGHAE